MGLQQIGKQRQEKFDTKKTVYLGKVGPLDTLRYLRLGRLGI